ncbi:Glutamate-1-semialdehyde 2,1-aminomutase, chloroplastic [Linum grandiflorum]
MAATFSGVGIGLHPSISSSSTHKLPRSQRKRIVRSSVKMAVSELMPGGVNSPVRAFRSVGGQPIVMDSVIEALSQVMKKGTSFGAPCLLENVLAEMVIKAVPSIEMVRFVNSGTEACIKFDGCYHGHADPFLVKAGSGVATLGLPDSPGVPKAATFETLVAPYNDIKAVETLFAANKDQIAALILEPVVGNSGFIPPKPDFLEAIRRITKENGALLMFDEVMTGFRLSYGGAQEYFGITPDITTLGKIIGGGLPVGAYGGRREIMEMVAPAGPMYQAGTLKHLDKITGKLVQGILEAGKKAGHAVCGGYIRGMFGFFFAEGPVYNFDDAKKSDTGKFARFYQGMLAEGVYFAPSQFEAGFTSLAHTDEDIQRTLEAAEKVMKQI